MHSKLVLVIEDHSVQNEKICNIVSKAGYQAIQAFNGVEGLKQLEKYRRGFGFLTNAIACILLDWNMPKMRGEEFIRILRKQEHEKSFSRYIPIIILSAYNDLDKKHLAVSDDGMAAAYLTKPFEPEELTALLCRIIQHQENEVLTAINRDALYHSGNLLAQRVDQEAEHQAQIRRAYFSGRINTQALEYLEQKKLTAEIDLEECQKQGKLNEKTVANFQSMVEFTHEEYSQLKQALECVK